MAFRRQVCVKRSPAGPLRTAPIPDGPTPLPTIPGGRADRSGVFRDTRVAARLMSLRATLRRHVFEDVSRPVRAAAEPALQRTGNRAQRATRTCGVHAVRVSVLVSHDAKVAAWLMSLSATFLLRRLRICPRPIGAILGSNCSPELLGARRGSLHA